MAEEMIAAIDLGSIPNGSTTTVYLIESYDETGVYHAMRVNDMDEAIRRTLLYKANLAAAADRDEPAPKGHGVQLAVEIVHRKVMIP